MKQQLQVTTLVGALFIASACTTDPGKSEGVQPGDARSEVPTSTQPKKMETANDEKVAAITDDESDSNKLICRRENKPGSHLKRTVCRTVAQTEQDRQAAQEQLRRQTGSSSTAPEGQ